MNVSIFIIVLLFVIYGLYKMILNENIHQAYVGISIFIMFKIIFNYNKCTISYIECKLRNVKKEKGYLFQFFEELINYRYNNYIFIPLTIVFTYLLYYFFIIHENKLKI